jgi:PBSX family phage terminase large subunit
MTDNQIQVKPVRMLARHRIFIDEYLKSWNATQAYLIAYPKSKIESARVLSCNLLTNVNIKAEIQVRIAQSRMSSDEAVTLLDKMARGEVPTKRIVKTSSLGNSETEEYEQIAAVDKIARIYGKYKLDETNQNKNPVILSSLPADIIAPEFFPVYRAIKDRRYTEYVLKGGRGSTKSSFVSEVFPWLIINNPNTHGLVLRQIKDTIRDSVFGQIKWAINELGLQEYFKCTVSPLEIEYLPTKQKIYFRGADDPANIKSIKPEFGYIAWLWFEELDQFHGPEAVRNIVQSALRGGEDAIMFKTFNPPRTSANWANKEILIPKPNRLVHSSSYLTVPVEWLGKPWLEEAEHLKEVNPRAYDHEYLGIANGYGGQVFENTVLRTISDDEIAQFDHVGQGVDWGYYPDPFAWGKSHYDANRRKLYIFDEFVANKLSNRAAYDKLVEDKLYSNTELIIADSAEPKSIADFREYGATIRGAEKGPESVAYSIKWLQGLTEIIIDPVRCPVHADEFSSYEYEQDKDGNYISSYPDNNNHCIDEIRYRTNLIWKVRGQ